MKTITARDIEVLKEKLEDAKFIINQYGTSHPHKSYEQGVADTLKQVLDL